MSITTRRRVIPPPGPSQGLLRSWSDGPGLNGKITKSITDHTFAKRSLNGVQTTVSESHAEWRDHVSGRVTRDIGGPFSSLKRYAVIPNGGSQYLYGQEPFNDFPGDKRYSRATYEGLMLPLAPNDPLLVFPPYINSSNSELDRKGTTAIARCSPTNPSADLSTFLGEVIQEGIPKIIGAGLHELRHASPKRARKVLSGEFLNFQFGWMPFISDVRSITSSIVHADSVISQYERDSGKLVRRSYGFPDEVSTSYNTVVTGVNPWFAPSTSVLYVKGSLATGKVIREWTQARKLWFKGAFTYYIPSGGNTRDRMARQVINAKKLLGVRLTPDSVWNLTPWSWAIDWFTNAGDVLKNLDAWTIDNQVLVYGYMMEHTVSTYRYVFIPPTTFQSQNVSPPEIRLISEAKIRRKATPYGFGFTWDGLSALQKAILVALGLNKWH